jgi:hypothetical protein
MTKEQAIKLLQKETSIAEINRLKYECGLSHNEVTERIQEAMDMGADAIENGMARKVIVSPYNGMKYCPECEISVTGMHFNYCVECGQKLDWSEVE